MKKITSLRLLLATMLLALTTGTAWAQTELLSSDNNTSAGVSGGGTNSVASFTSGDITATVDNGYWTGSQLRVYKNATLTISTTSGNITAIDFAGVLNSSKCCEQLSTETGSYTAASDKKSGSWTGEATSIEFAAAAQVRLTSIVVTVTSSTPGDNRTATTITIDDAGITNTNVFTGTAAGSLAATVVAGEATVTNADITWSSETPGVATIDNTGAITLVAAGSTVITAEFAGDNSYKPSTKTYTLTVTNDDPNGPGTVNNPYTVAQARAAIDAGTGVTGVYATGIVSEIVTAYNSLYGNITYNISADGSTTGDQLQAYRGKSFNGNNFTSEDDIQVGAKVVIYGNLKLYAATSTYEFDQNNQLVSYIAPVIAIEKPAFDIAAGTYTEAQTVTITAEKAAVMVLYTTDGTDPSYANNNGEVYTAPVQITTTTTLKAIAVDAQDNESFVTSAEYVIKPTAPTFSVETGNFSAAFDLEITGANANGMVIYTTDGRNPNYTTGVIGKAYTTPINISATTVVKAIYVDQYGNVSDIASATYTLIDPYSVEATFDFTDANWVGSVGLYNSSFVTKIVSDNLELGASKANGTSKPSYYSDPASFRVYNKNEFAIASTDGTPITSIVITSVSGSQSVETAGLSLVNGQPGTLVVKGNTATWTSSSNDVVLVKFANTTQARIQTITITTKSDVTVTENVTISDAGYGTLYTEKPFEVPAGMTAGIISAASAADADGIATLTLDWNYPEGTLVPAATPLLIKGAAADYTYICKGTTEAAPEGNLLKGSAVATITTGGNYYYMLSYGTGERANTLGFFYGAANGWPFTSAAGKCWLAVSSSSNIRGFVFDLGGDVTTGINSVNAAANGQAVYDLQGRRVSNATKGVYIINGKKVLVK